jgi:hypothetical protein
LTPSHRQQRASAGSVAAFVLLCQAAAWVHAAAIPHLTCLEHGDSVHLDAHGQAGLPQSDVPAVAAAPAQEATAHAHEHCNLDGHRTASTPAAAPSDVAATVVAGATPTAAAPPPAVRLLLLAPKTSPPRAPAV